MKTENMAKFGRGDMAIILACMLMGLGTVIIKNVLGDTPDRLSVHIFNGIRLPLMGTALLTIERLMGNDIRIAHRERPHFAALGLIGFLNMLAFMYGLKLTTAGNAGVITATIPLFILLVSFLTGMEKLTRGMIVGVAVGFVGAVVLNFQKGDLDIRTGDLLVLAACMLMAIFTVYSKRLLDTYNPLTTAGWFFLLIYFYQLPFFISELPGRDWSAVSRTTWIYFIIALFGPLSLTNALYYYALRSIGPARVGLYNNLTPIFTLLLAVSVRGESITLMQVAGLAIILGGITITKIEGFMRPVKKPLL